MKKISLCVFVALCTLMFVLSGCSNNVVFEEKSYKSEEDIVKSIDIQVEDRYLEIGNSDDNCVYIEYFDSEKEFLDISLSASNVLTVKLVYDKVWTDYVGVKPSADYRKIKIKIPNNLLVSLVAKTTNENIALKSVSLIENVDINVSDGDLLCENVSVGKSIKLTAKNGDIKGSIVGGWDDFAISCTIKKGNSNLPALKEGGEKSLYANCNNGDINLKLIK